MALVPVTPPLTPFVIERAGIRLRPWVVGDLACVADATTDPFIPALTTVPGVFTTEAGLAFIRRQHGRLASGEGWAMVIADATTDLALGHIGLWLHQIWKGRAELGYWVAPSGRGRGAAGDALELLSDWAFAHIDVDRLSLFIEPWNEASIRTAERAGYVREAFLERWERVSGEPRNMFSYRRLRVSD